VKDGRSKREELEGRFAGQKKKLRVCRCVLGEVPTVMKTLGRCQTYRRKAGYNGSSPRSRSAIVVLKSPEKPSNCGLGQGSGIFGRD